MVLKQLKYFLLVAALTFTVMGCNKTIEVSFDNDTQEVEAQGGSMEISLKSNGDWTIESTAEWISIEPMSGKGDATLTLTAEANTTGETRSAEVKATTKDNTAVLTLTQASVEYYLNVTPKEITCGNEGGEFTIELTSNINWFVSAPDWITCSPAEGSGDASITMTISPIEGEFSDSHDAQVFFGNLSVYEYVHVVQTVEPDPGPGPGPDPGPEPEPHVLEVTPLEFVFEKEGGEREITIHCDTLWEFDLDCDWLSLSQHSGNGDATVTLTAEPNEMSEPRTMVFHIKSVDLHCELSVSQAAGDIIPEVAFDADTVFVPYTGGVQHVELTSNTDWSLQTGASWITLLPPTSGNGDYSFDIIVNSNSNPEGRMTRLNAIHAGQVMASMVIAQEGKPNILETDVTELSVRPEGGEYIIQVTANQDWIVDVGANWMRCNPQNGYGSGSITLTVDPLNSVHPRTGLIKVSGSTGAQVIITVEQH